LIVASVLVAPHAAGEQSSKETSPESAGLAEEHRLVYRPEWRRFELVDYVTTLAVAGAFVYVQFFVEPQVEPRWTSPILFDEAARDALVGESKDARNNAAVVSDILWYTPLLTPFVESAVVPLFFDRWNLDVAWQLTAINFQSAAVSALLTRSGHRLVGRQRPDVEPCRLDPEYDGQCFGGANASFPSGHSSAAFLGAGLACAHHSNLPLYGGGAPDIAVCALTTAMSVGNGFARIVADRHYASDVLVGAAIGVGSGFAMPVLLHYGGVGTFSVHPAREHAREARVDVLFTPFATPEGVGAAATGRF
jgi:membrane-associated phospholipid phosphatase